MKDTRSYRKRNNKLQLRLPKLHVHNDKPHDVTAYGGLSLVHQLARKLQFVRHINQCVRVLKIRQGYGESDHLYHLLSALFAGAGCVEDLGQFKDNTAYKKSLEVESVTDPTTMGDFLRRFTRRDINNLKTAMWGMRREAWGKIPKKKRRRASLDLDSKICPVYGNKKEGADFTYQGSYGYHPEMVSLAETGEWLDAVNRSGNEVSGDKAAYLLRRTLAGVKEYFDSICVRGDTKFGRGDVLITSAAHGAFVCVGWAASPTVVQIAEGLPEERWELFERRQSRGTAKSRTRKKRRNLRRMKARKRGYTDKKLKKEWVAEFPYQPIYNKKPLPKTYRMIVVRKQIEVAGKTGLFDQYAYRFILTDLPGSELAELVRYAYGRCHQENLIEQGKNGVSAFKMPTGQLLANEVWMLMAMLAQNFKSYLCLLALGKDKIGWEWKRFRFNFMYFAARVTRAGRQTHLWLDPNHLHLDKIRAGLCLLGAGYT